MRTNRTQRGRASCSCVPPTRRDEGVSRPQHQGRSQRDPRRQGGPPSA